jgi:hypothetical protein
MGGAGVSAAEQNRSGSMPASLRLLTLGQQEAERLVERMGARAINPGGSNGHSA